MHHDSGYKLLFSHPELIRELIEGFVPGEIVALVDFSSLERLNASFVSREMQQREGDMIWSVRIRDQTLYLYLLLEFQSRVDHAMPVRMLQYVASLYDHLIREKQVTPQTGLPPVLPMVLYNGDSRWRAPTALARMIRAPSALVKWQPNLEFLLLDEGALSQEKLDAIGSLVALIFKADTVKNVHEGRRIFRRMGELWRKTPYGEEVERSLRAWLSSAFQRQGLPTAVIGEWLDGGVSMLAENVEKWYEQAKREGLIEGREEGREKGREEGREEGLREAVLALHKNGMAAEAIASALELPLEKIHAWIASRRDGR